MSQYIQKKFYLFIGRIKRKLRNISKNKWKIFTYFLKFFWGSFLLFSFFIIGIEIFQHSKKFFEEQKNLKQENFALLEEMQNINEKLFQSCQNENTIRRYLLLAENDCENFLGESIEIKENRISLLENFFSFFHLFFVERDNFPEVYKDIIAEYGRRDKRENLFETKEDGGEKSDKTIIVQKEFEELKQNTDIKKYIRSFGYDLIIPSDKKNILFLVDKENSKKVFAEISKNIFLLKTENVFFDSKTFAKKREEIEEKIAKNNEKNIFDELKNSNILSSEFAKSQLRENLLIVGHNEGNTDTIILLVIDHSRKKITMISIPRDLWISGRRINSFRLKFGHNVFVKQIEKISGQKISYSFVVDMDIFPQLIDKMGGVDFVFKTPLIDPTYKTLDNGKRGTLFYDVGMHHLSGIEALRVVRSRHTTNDFSRAKRQQKLLSMIREKFSQKTFTELLPLIKIIFKNVETDITPIIASKIFLETSGYELRSGVVLSTQNVLKSKMIDVGRGKKAYALLPKNGDWSIIKKFIWREILKE